MAVPPGEACGRRSPFALPRTRARLHWRSCHRPHAPILTFRAAAMMKRARGGAKPLAEFTPGLIAEALAARGLGETSLIADWPAIVGEALARHARPIELQWPPRAAKRDPEAPVAPATLVLRVEGAFALEAQHSASVIVARVNAHLGWRCVDKIAFRQGPLPPLKEKRRARAGPLRRGGSRRAAPPPRRSRTTSLRDAVTRLGARAIDRSARLRGRRAPERKGRLGLDLPPSARRAHDRAHERRRQRDPGARPARFARRARRRRTRAPSIARRASTTIR